VAFPNHSWRQNFHLSLVLNPLISKVPSEIIKSTKKELVFLFLKQFFRVLVMEIQVLIQVSKILTFVNSYLAAFVSVLTLDEQLIKDSMDE